jgi:ribosome-binding protein aMBF1 (putative translation factor)
MKKQTAGQRWLAKRMENPEFAAEFKKSRAEIDIVDGFIRALDERRTELGMSKGELALRVSQNPSALRRLLTSGGNPSLKTALELADAVGLVVRLEPVKATLTSPKPRTPKSARRPANA